MNESIKERISALVDGELSEFEVRRVLEEIEKEPNLRNYWDLLQITRRSLANEDLGKLDVDISERVRKELLGRKLHSSEEYSSYSRYKSYLAASAGLALVLGINFLVTTPNKSIDSFSDEASQTIANAIASPEALEVLNNSVLDIDARLQDFNYVTGGGMHANYVFPENGRKFRVSLSPVMSEFKPNRSPELRRVFIKTDKGVFVVSISGNITDEKKSRILQNANYFSNQIK